jgi:hypothetical protein
MPNWCINNIEISGPAKEIARFKQTCIRPDNENDGKPCFDFNSIIPMPAILEGTIVPGEVDIEAFKQTGSPNWYDWANKNWGTKWNAAEFRAEPEGNPKHYSCVESS